MELPVNPCMTAFGLKLIGKELWSFIQSFPQEVPLVSVGSGLGILERILKDNVMEKGDSKRKIITVDPSPNSYLHLSKERYAEAVEKHGLTPDYEYLDDLLIERPQLMAGSRSILLLNWCDYGSHHSYDLRAMSLLRPLGIFVLTQMNGAAHSELFHSFLSSPSSMGYHPKRIYRVEPDRSQEDCLLDDVPLAMQWLVLKEVDPSEKIIYIRCPCKTDHSEPAREKRDETMKQVACNELMRLLLQMGKNRSCSHKS